MLNINADVLRRQIANRIEKRFPGLAARGGSQAQRGGNAYEVTCPINVADNDAYGLLKKLLEGDKLRCVAIGNRKIILHGRKTDPKNPKTAYEYMVRIAAMEKGKPDGNGGWSFGSYDDEKHPENVSLKFYELFREKLSKLSVSTPASAEQTEQRYIYAAMRIHKKTLGCITKHLQSKGGETDPITKLVQDSEDPNKTPCFDYFRVTFSEMTRPQHLKYEVAYLSKFFRDNTLPSVANTSLSVAVWRQILGQLFVFLAQVQCPFPSFRHNRFDIQHCEIMYCMAATPTTGRTVQKTIGSYKFNLPSPDKVQVLVGDLIYAVIPGQLENYAVDQKPDKPNPYFDVYYLLRSLVGFNKYSPFGIVGAKLMNDENSVIPKEVRDFIRRNLPQNTDYSFTSDVPKNLFLPDENYQYKSALQILLTDPFFTEYKSANLPPVDELTEYPACAPNISAGATAEPAVPTASPKAAQVTQPTPSVPEVKPQTNPAASPISISLSDLTPLIGGGDSEQPPVQKPERVDQQVVQPVDQPVATTDSIELSALAAIVDEQPREPFPAANPQTGHGGGNVFANALGAPSMPDANLTSMADASGNMFSAALGNAGVQQFQPTFDGQHFSIPIGGQPRLQQVQSGQFGMPLGQFGAQSALGATPPFGAPTAAYGAPTAAYGAPSAAYGAPSAAFGSQSAAFGAPSAAFGSQSAAFGAPSAAFGAPSAAFGAPSAAFGAPSAAFGAPSAAFGAPSAAFGAPSAAFGAQSAAFGAPSAAFDGQLPFGGMQPPQFGLPPISFGSQFGGQFGGDERKKKTSHSLRVKSTTRSRKEVQL